MANIREAVLSGLYDVEENRAYMNQTLQKVLAKTDSAQNRAFASELFGGVLRREENLNYLISQFSTVKLRKLSPYVRCLLQMGLYQIFYMDRVPDSAACNEAVRLAGKYANRSRGFVNGVLRSAARNKDSVEYPSDPLSYLSAVYSCPAWLTQKLFSQYGRETAEKILNSWQSRIPVNLRVNTLKTDADTLISLLQGEGIHAEKIPNHTNALTVTGAIDIRQSSAYQNGLYSVQSLSSMAAAEALAPKPGQSILDLCAAPGGKSCYLAEQMENRGEILACDIHPHKINLINSAAKRHGISCVHAAVWDASQFREEWKAGFDAVLADVPCSGIGVIPKKPDIKRNRIEADIPALCDLQQRILQNAAQYLKQGGRLVYSTCTVLQEENELQIRTFLKNNPQFTMTEENLLLTHETGSFGFYYAVLKLKG